MPDKKEFVDPYTGFFYLGWTEGNVFKYELKLEGIINPIPANKEHGVLKFDCNKN
jgi:hypothetical protein